MCQLNMDAYQSAVNRYFNTNFQMPIIFFTQLLGVALGIDFGKVAIGKEIVSAERVIRAKLNGETAGAAK
jgi:heterodisulfide reductase subunit B